jgi:hypothetical protein
VVILRFYATWPLAVLEPFGSTLTLRDRFLWSPLRLVTLSYVMSTRTGLPSRACDRPATPRLSDMGIRRPVDRVRRRHHQHGHRHPESEHGGARRVGLGAAADWSPNGQRFSYVGRQEGFDQAIFVMSVDGFPCPAPHGWNGPGSGPGVVARRRMDRVSQARRIHERRRVARASDGGQDSSGSPLFAQQVRCSAAAARAGSSSPNRTTARSVGRHSTWTPRSRRRSSVDGSGRICDDAPVPTISRSGSSSRTSSRSSSTRE